MYKTIEILETDFKDKYLLKSNKNLMYIGFVVKEIIELIKEGKSRGEISETLSIKFKTEISIDKILEVENNIIYFLNKEHKSSSFYKLCKLFNPSILTPPKIFLNIFNFIPFYFILITTLIINVYIYSSSIDYITDSLFDKTIIYLLLFLVLIIHELGHSLAAKKFNVDVQELGFGIYYFIPVLYVNLDEMWKLKKNKKVVINLAGIFFQLISGVILFLISLQFSNYSNIFMTVFHLNLLIILININPFFKFDGYWIISDLLNETKLIEESRNYLKNYLKNKKSNQNYLISVYSILRILFIGWLSYKMFEYLYSIFIKVIHNQTLIWSEYLCISLLLYIFFKIIINYINKKYGLFRKSKKSISETIE